VHAPGTDLVDRAADGIPSGGAGDPVDRARELLAAPTALLVVAGGPGSGRSTTLNRLRAEFRGPVFAGGGLATLRDVPALALSRAVKVRLPAHDLALLAEAVRSRVRYGLLLLDDLQWADAATVATVCALAAHCRVAVTLRTPHRLPAEAMAGLQAAAAGWLTLAPLTPQAAADLARRAAPALDPAAVDQVVRRAGGVPLAVTALARHAAAHAGRPTTVGHAGRAGADQAGPDQTGPDQAGPDQAGPDQAGPDQAGPDQAGPDQTGPDQTGPDQVGYAVAIALADLTRPARTAMAALGLLGRPATAAVLGAGAEELLDAGLVAAAEGSLSAVSPYLAEVAAGMLDDGARRALHRRLAELTPAREAARHLAAAGDDAAAHDRAVAAATAASTAGERADLLLLACALPAAAPTPQTRVAAARAALAAGRPRAAVRVLATTGPLGVDAAVVRAEALLQAGDPAAARAAATPIPDAVDPSLRASRDRVLLLAALADDPASAAALAARHDEAPDHPGLRAAVAAVRADARAPGWEYGLASAAETAGAAGDALTAGWSAWLLVETLAADGRLDAAARTAAAAADACAADLAYSWQTRFLAAALWCAALRGSSVDDVVRRAADLTDRTVPALARAYAVAAAALVEADGGLLGTARTRLAAAPPAAGAAALLDWVGREAAWLDGQPDRATAPATTVGPPLVEGLRRITAQWAAFDAGTAPVDLDTDLPVPAVRATLTAWDTGGGFTNAAAAWHDLAVREEVRCLLAAGLHEPDPALAVPSLLQAERLAEAAGLVVLQGRVRRALRRHAVRRDSRGPRGGGDLTDRERDVLRLVARGEPTRRIAGQLGISAETVETHIRSGMRKLGARTRTAAAVLALEALG
jgi:DNA-binding CsgD family transcriptional regulator